MNGCTDDSPRCQPSKSTRGNKNRRPGPGGETLDDSPRDSGGGGGYRRGFGQRRGSFV